MHEHETRPQAGRRSQMEGKGWSGGGRGMVVPTVTSAKSRGGDDWSSGGRWFLVRRRAWVAAGGVVVAGGGTVPRGNSGVPAVTAAKIGDG